ncbi:hypothetical protein L1887_10989 [Cichorium endivia]|nr:hypothetical protein L1887_10989 [Cichorium endivia]
MGVWRLRRGHSLKEAMDTGIDRKDLFVTSNIKNGVENVLDQFNQIPNMHLSRKMYNHDVTYNALYAVAFGPRYLFSLRRSWIVTMENLLGPKLKYKTSTLHSRLDDAHICCRESRIKDEVKSVINLVCQIRHARVNGKKMPKKINLASCHLDDEATELRLSVKYKTHNKDTRKILLFEPDRPATRRCFGNPGTAIIAVRLKNQNFFTAQNR